MNEDLQVDRSMRDQDNDAFAIQVEAVVDPSFDHLGSGILTRSRVQSHPHGKLFQESKSKCSIFGLETEKEFPPILGVDLELDSNFLTSWTDEGRFSKFDNRIEWHEAEMDLLGDTPDGLKMHAHDTQSKDGGHVRVEEEMR